MTLSFSPQNVLPQILSNTFGTPTGPSYGNANSPAQAANAVASTKSS